MLYNFIHSLRTIMRTRLPTNTLVSDTCVWPGFQPFMAANLTLCLQDTSIVIKWYSSKRYITVRTTQRTGKANWPKICLPCLNRSKTQLFQSSVRKYQIRMTKNGVLYDNTWFWKFQTWLATKQQFWILLQNSLLTLSSYSTTYLRYYPGNI